MNNIIKKPKLSEFKHRPAGHCETGSVSALVSHHGFEISEPMVFGIASGITCFYLPFVKIWNFPLISFRMAPRSIITGVEKRLGIKFFKTTFKDQKQAMDELDKCLKNDQPVGCTAGISALPYFTPDMRIYFNAHSTIAIGKEGDEYIISDPVFDHTNRCSVKDYQRARFVKGANAPNGFMWYPTFIPEKIDFPPAIEKAIKSTVNMMLQPMFFFVGLKGIKTVIKKVESLQKNPDKKYVKGFLNHIVLFQEEVGTGGAGFRYMYAGFLKEAYEMMKIPELEKAAEQFVATGDVMRKAAIAMAKVIRGKQSPDDLSEILGHMHNWYKMEREAYLILKSIDWKKKY
jgi:hypothetical protein